MLQSMRVAAKWIWWAIAILFLVGFVFYEQSGLSGEKVTAGSTVAKVNGTPIAYADFERQSQLRIRDEQANSGKSLTLDQERRIEDDTFNRDGHGTSSSSRSIQARGITVSDAEIRGRGAIQPAAAARCRAPISRRKDSSISRNIAASSRAPWRSSKGSCRRSEQYYRDAASQAEALRADRRPRLRDRRSALARIPGCARLRAGLVRRARPRHRFPTPRFTSPTRSSRRISTATRRSSRDRPGRAVLSIVAIPRVVTAADTAAARAKADSLRAEIARGAKFEDVAKRESADSASAVKGGRWERSARERS